MKINWKTDLVWEGIFKTSSLIISTLHFRMTNISICSGMRNFSGETRVDCGIWDGWSPYLQKHIWKVWESNK